MRERAIDVLLEVCKPYGLTLEDMRSPSRERRISWPRHHVCYEIFTRCPHMSLPAIGALLGGKDHTSVLHGVGSHAKKIGTTYEAARNKRMALADALCVDCSTSQSGKEKRFRNLILAYGHRMEVACAA